MNFELLREKWPKLANLGLEAEKYAYSDPQSSMLKLRCFIELIVSNIYHDLKLSCDYNWSLLDKLKNKQFSQIISDEILNKFHAIRIKANKSIHNNVIISSNEAIWLLEEAYQISCWVYKSYEYNADISFKDFIKPKDNGDKLNVLNETIKELENTLEKEKNRNLRNHSINNNIEQLEKFRNKNISVSKSLNLNNDEIKKQISLEEIFIDYELTSSQTELISELKVFLENKDKNVFLLKGYAGTGKTFITKGFTEYLTCIGRKFILGAPTGKAAKVIQEKTKSDAYTIHKTIYSDKDLKEYKIDEEDKTYKFYFDLRVNEDTNDAIYIIDEASMISNIYSEMEFLRFGSGFLLNDLLKYINLDQNDHNKKIIFIGDNAQLPPVGMKFSPALDSKYLSEKFNLHTTELELTEVVRQKEDSGILKNSIIIRKSLSDKIFNQIQIDDTYPDIEHVNHNRFMDKYIEITNGRISKDTMVIAYTNASVKDYNQSIRKHFFSDIDKININDKIIILSNSSHYDIFLSNGDFGLVKNILSETEKRIITLKRKNVETNIVEEIKVNLEFRDIELIVKDVNETAYVIKCKIIENLLFSEKAGLSSDENKALYLDFVMRNPNLKPNTKEFKDEIRSDPYFNALKIKFGYAITCHKAQGSEWKNVILNCRYNENTLSESYFRWIYTAITRASNNLYTLDEPNISMLDNLKVNTHLEHISDTFTNNDLTTNNDTKDNEFNINDKFLLVIYQKIVSIVGKNDIKILDIQHNQNQEQYTFESNNEQSRFIIYYNAKDIITSINPIENNNLSNLLKVILEPLKKHILTVEKHTDFTFKEIFLEDFYLSLKDKLSDKKITIANIEHLAYMERYTFSRDKEIAIIDFYYNGKGQFKSPTPNNKSNSKSLIQDILGIGSV